MSLSTIRKAFIDWVRFSTGYNAEHVIWEDQDMPRPSKPYVSLKMTAFKSRNQEHIAAPNVDGHAYISTHKDFSLGVHCYGGNKQATNYQDPIEVLLNLQDSLGMSEVYDILGSKGIAFVDNLLGPTDTSLVRDTMFEPRASLDLMMRIPWTMTDLKQGVIEKVGVGGLVFDIDSSTIDAISISVSTVSQIPVT